MKNDHVNISLELLLKHSGSNRYFGVKCSRSNVYLLPRSFALRHQVARVSLAIRARLLCAKNESPETQGPEEMCLYLEHYNPFETL